MGNNKVFTPPCDWDNGTYAVDGVQRTPPPPHIGFFVNQFQISLSIS